VRNSLVTGANRGIGLAFACALLSHGAAKVYAGVRRPEDFFEPGLQPLLLDFTNQQDIDAAATLAFDANIVVNNAGIIACPARKLGLMVCAGVCCGIGSMAGTISG
jgi:NAD(P)-dependent dehydrogenase (short-subunit alcohol dehydrogenase family)